MRGISLCFLGVTVFAIGMGSTCRAQDKPAENAATAAAAPTSGARAEFIDRLDFYEQRFTSLAQAVPAEKYTWRPGEGVRSIGEVFLHVAAANFNLPRLIGVPPPAGLDVPGLEKSTTDKAKIIQTLKDSFAHYRQGVLSLSEADVEKTVKLFGKDRTYRYVFLFCTGHLGEHLGQSIAYARSNGVVPPWTEEQQQQQKQAQKPKS
ncbi:MAG: DinB family protein [Candidatus Acidiferrum sp.]